MNNILEIRGLTKSYPSFDLGPLNLAIPKGVIVGYIGENGAGKTTTIKLIMDLIREDEGEIQVFGMHMAQDPKGIRSKIGVVFDDLNLPEDLCLSDVGLICRQMFPHWDGDLFSSYQRVFKLEPKKRVKELSRGMRMKLSIAIALSHGAELLILDEPTSGLDPVIREEILDILLEFIQEENHAVLFSSHILTDLEKIADYIALIHKGKLIFMEEKDVLRDEYAIYHSDPNRPYPFAEGVILAERKHHYGDQILVKRSEVPRDLPLDRPSLEEIMLFFIKGGANDVSNGI